MLLKKTCATYVRKLKVKTIHGLDVTLAHAGFTGFVLDSNGNPARRENFHAAFARSKHLTLPSTSFSTTIVS